MARRRRQRARRLAWAGGTQKQTAWEEIEQKAL